MRTLKSSLLCTALLLGAFLAPAGAQAQQQMGPDMMNQGPMNPGMMGQGMMGQGPMGQGMMGPGMGGAAPACGMMGGMMGGMTPGTMGMMHGDGGMGGMAGGRMMGSQMTGPAGMMGQGGMMGRGMMMGMMGDGQAFIMRPAPAQLSADDVSYNLARMLELRGNPHLKVGKVADKNDATILGEIVTSEGSLVERYEVDKRTGLARMVP